MAYWDSWTWLARVTLYSCVAFWSFEGCSASVHLRIGKDFTASAVVLLCKLGLYPGRSLDKRLYEAFKSYVEWCAQHGKNTSVRMFSRRDFKMKG